MQLLRDLGQTEGPPVDVPREVGRRARGKGRLGGADVHRKVDPCQPVVEPILQGEADGVGDLRTHHRGQPRHRAHDVVDAVSAAAIALPRPPLALRGEGGRGSQVQVSQKLVEVLAGCRLLGRLVPAHVDRLDRADPGVGVAEDEQRGARRPELPEGGSGLRPPLGPHLGPVSQVGGVEDCEAGNLRLPNQRHHQQPRSRVQHEDGIVVDVELGVDPKLNSTSPSGVRSSDDPGESPALADLGLRRPCFLHSHKMNAGIAELFF